jgi:hypothetical protein
VAASLSLLEEEFTNFALQLFTGPFKLLFLLPQRVDRADHLDVFC